MIFRTNKNCIEPLINLPVLKEASQYAFAAGAVALAFGVLATPVAAQQPKYRDLQSDTWVATDAFGHVAPIEATARSARKDKFVGIFYFIWQSRSDEVYDNSKAIAANPADPKYGPRSAFHWWGEPAVGYFRADDPWVARKNLQMLGDAGVDVLILDATNAFTYPNDVQTLCDTAEQMRHEGFKTPDIAFITHSGTVKTVTTLYNTYYALGLYKDLWFLWDGKPLILGDKAANDHGETLGPKIVDFFTWRYSWAWDPGKDKWQWIDKYPQRSGWHDNPSKPEEMPVSIAGHPIDNLGRSYHSDETWGKGTEPPVDQYHATSESVKGLQFAQQWKQALKVDPEFIFVTGWNEWIAQRFVSGADGGPTFLGRKLRPGETFFVDNYNEEFSRDAMPMKGRYGDNYYMQLVDGIRRFKGVRPIAVSHDFHTIALDNFDAWSKVTPEYLDAIGDVTHRDWDGWKGHHYTNAMGRNDIVSAKVACDAKNIYFYVHTQEKLTPHTDLNWMQLLIDSDQDAKTGWHGYDFVVNSKVVSAAQTTLRRLSDGKTWPVAYRVYGDEMMIVIPRPLIGQANLNETAFDFHWADNVPVGSGDIADWWYDGDSAPDGRFNYRYENIKAPARK